MPATVTNIKDAAEKRDRIAAFHVGEGVLEIYERVFQGDPRLRFVLPGAHHYATGLISLSRLEACKQNAQEVIDDAAFVAQHTDSPASNDIYSAIMAAYTVILCFEPVIDLELIKTKAAEAMRFSATRSA